MDDLNQTLFLLLNAPEHPSAFLLGMAKFWAEYTVWIIPLGLLVGWMRGSPRTRKVLIEAAASGLAGLLINQIIGYFWQHPRPFMMGLGHTFLNHAPDSSFPSDHLTLLWAVAFNILMHKRPRISGLILAMLGLPVAWARIYLGVHFPLDMVGAALVAFLSASMVLRKADRYVARLYEVVIQVHQKLFAPLIARGWIRE